MKLASLLNIMRLVEQGRLGFRQETNETKRKKEIGGALLVRRKEGRKGLRVTVNLPGVLFIQEWAGPLHLRTHGVALLWLPFKKVKDFAHATMQVLNGAISW